MHAGAVHLSSMLCPTYPLHGVHGAVWGNDRIATFSQSYALPLGLGLACISPTHTHARLTEQDKDCLRRWMLKDGSTFGTGLPAFHMQSNS